MAYSELLPYATPGFVAFGAGSLITGWLGDRWSRRHMMVIFFVGIGLSMIAVGFVRRPLQSARRCCRSAFSPRSTIPVGTAMIGVLCRAARPRDGDQRRLGQSRRGFLLALVTGVIGQYLGWRLAFIVPGIVTIGLGIAFAHDGGP